MKTSLIIPTYNEEKGLPKVLEEYRDLVDEIIVVDDGSTDGTPDVLKKYVGDKIKAYRNEENKGKPAAIRTGIEHASGEIIILTDADYTYPARYLPKFIDAINKGTDLVLGSRFLGKACNMPRLNRIGNTLFSFLINYLGVVDITDGQTGYRAFKKELFDELGIDATGLEFETKMTVTAAKLGYTIVEIPIEYRERIGKSKLNPIKDGYKMFFSLLSIAVKETSIVAKTIMFPSVPLLFIGVTFGIISIHEKIKYGILNHQYYPLLATLFILIAFQLFSVGLLIDYITKKLHRIDEKISRRD